MSRKDDIKKLLVNNNRRLQKLKEQKALQGISVDPKIILEIEDIETAIGGLQIELEELEVKRVQTISDPGYEQILNSIKEKTFHSLSYLPSNIDNLYGVKHINRVLRLLQTLISLAEIKSIQLSARELFMLKAATYLHPISLSLTNPLSSLFLKETYPTRDLDKLPKVEQEYLLHKHYLELSAELLEDAMDSTAKLALFGIKNTGQARSLVALLKTGNTSLYEVPQKTIFDGHTIRLKLLSAFFRLANALDIDIRGFEPTNKNSTELAPDLNLKQSLRQYVEGIIISEYEMQFYYVVPEGSYVIPLKALITGCFLRTYFETAPIFAEYGWLLPPPTSQVETAVKPPLPSNLLKLLKDRDWSHECLTPLTEVLGKGSQSGNISQLHPYHFGNIRTLTQFSWNLGLGGEATYQIKLQHKESKEILLQTTINACQFNYPDDAPTLNPGDLYQLSIKGRQINKKVRVLGFFRILNQAELDSLVKSEQLINELETQERLLALGILYKIKGLYGETVSLLREFINTCSDSSAVLLARRILAEMYEDIYVALKRLGQYRKADLFLQESQHQYSLVHNILVDNVNLGD